VRSRIADHGLDTYVQGQRALRLYCTTTGFSWLKEVQGAAIQFLNGVSEYPLGDLGLRRIDAIWVQDSSNGEWHLMVEATHQTFERHATDAIEDEVINDLSTGLTGRAPLTSQDDTQSSTLYYTLQGSNLLTLRITPTPSQDLQGRIDGIVNTPVIQRTKELPGPSEYHYLVGDLWVGYELEHQGVLKLKDGKSQDDLMFARDLRSQGQREVQTAMTLMERVVRDTFPNRTGTIKWAKLPLMR
jgi:hypothetical protein